MQLTKRQSLIIALAILALFFALASAVVKYRRPAGKSGGESAPTKQPAASAADAGASSSDESTSKVVLNNFHRSETRDGQKLWEVTAQHGQYYPETSTAQLSRARLVFFRKTGEVVTLDAQKAELFFDDYTLSRANLTEGLELNFQDQVRVKTEAASYDRQSNTVHAPGKVTVEHAVAEISGEDLSADIASGQVTLARNVDTMIKPREKTERKKE